MTRLLISVRSLAEASVCIHNGADMIDIKEPSRGSMGMSSLETIRGIAREVPPRFAVSAALGEWIDWHRSGKAPVVPEGLSYLKVGLEGAAEIESWREDVGQFCREVCGRSGIYSEPSWVAVAYADREIARSPRPEEILDFAAANGFSVFLLDTWRKDGSSLFDHMGVETVSHLADLARLRGLEVALAGALRARQIEKVLQVSPDVVAFRSAACQGSHREAAIDPGAVSSLAALFAQAGEAVGAGL